MGASSYPTCELCCAALRASSRLPAPPTCDVSAAPLDRSAVLRPFFRDGHERAWRSGRQGLILSLWLKIRTTRTTGSGGLSCRPNLAGACVGPRRRRSGSLRRRWFRACGYRMWPGDGTSTRRRYSVGRLRRSHSVCLCVPQGHLVSSAMLATFPHDRLDLRIWRPFR